MLNVKETAGLLGVSEKTVYRWISAEKIPFTKIGEQYRFSESDLETWTSASKFTPNVSFKTEEKLSPEELPALFDAVNEGGIYYRVDGKSPEEVIREICSIVRLPREADPEIVMQSVAAREVLASTALGDGIAIPHMRNPLSGISSSTVSICFLKTPVAWNAIDGKAVSVVFFPCCENMQIHLHLLSRISFTARQDEFKKLIAKEASRKSILEYLQSNTEANQE